MIRFLIIFNLFCISAFSQDRQHLTYDDTIYFSFPRVDSLKFENLLYRYSTNGTDVEYTLKDEKNRYINLGTQTTSGLAKFSKTVKTKKFLRHNKKSIVNLDFINKNGLGNTFFSIIGITKCKKVLYIIDESELESKTMTIRRSIAFYPAFVEM